MRIINVVRIKNSVLDNIESFAVWKEEELDYVVKAAEAEFVEQAKKFGWNPEDHYCESEDDLLDEGYYETDNGDISICISWSNVI